MSRSELAVSIMATVFLAPAPGGDGWEDPALTSTPAQG